MTRLPDQDALISRYIALLDVAGVDPLPILRDALEDPHLFCYAELLHHPATSTVDEKWLKLLDLLSYGEVRDLASLSLSCRSTETLTPRMKRKLEMLTVLTEVFEFGACEVPLTALANRCFPDTHFVDFFRTIQLLLEMTELGLVAAEIDERRGTVDVTDVAVGRNVRDQAELTDRVDEMLCRIEKVLADPTCHLSPELRDFIRVYKATAEK